MKENIHLQQRIYNLIENIVQLETSLIQANQNQENENSPQNFKDGVNKKKTYLY